MLLPTATHQIYPSRLVDFGGDESYELAYHSQNRLLQHYSRRTNKATGWIQSILNVAARVIYGQARFDHITPTLRDRMLWLSVPQRIEFKQCLLVYKEIHGLAPTLHHQLLHWISIKTVPPFIRVLAIPRFPHCKTVMLSERSFLIGGPNLWNNLPDTVKKADNVELSRN